jgi:hypothetical protein
MGADTVSFVTLPIPGELHGHTGCFHVACPLGLGVELFLFGAGSPFPRWDGERIRIPAGKRLAGTVRLAGEVGPLSRRLVASGALDGLAVRWNELFSDGERWFEFDAEANWPVIGRLRDWLNAQVALS